MPLLLSSKLGLQGVPAAALHRGRERLPHPPRLLQRRIGSEAMPVDCCCLRLDHWTFDRGRYDLSCATKRDGAPARRAPMVRPTRPPGATGAQGGSDPAMHA